MNLAVVVDPARRGVVIDDDADTFGQRLAAGGSVEFHDVPVGADHVFCSLSTDEDLLSPRAALASPVGRLISAQLLLGMAEGVLAEAREYSGTGHAPWHPAWPTGTPHDPQAQTDLRRTHRPHPLRVRAHAAQESTSRALDIIGARSTSAQLGFDRFWRNARTHTVYEPVAHPLRDVGEYFLNRAHPPFALPA